MFPPRFHENTAFLKTIRPYTEEIVMAVVLENACIRVALDEKTGAFQSIYDKRKSYEYLIPVERAALFRLMTPDGDAQCRHVDSRDPIITVSETTATLTYCLNGIEAVAEIRLQGDEILTELRLDNRGSDIIEEVMFPRVCGVGPAPQGAFVWPCFWRRKFDDVFGKDFGGDHRTWNDWTQKQLARYPSHLTTAWCDYGNQDHGLALEGRHTDFSMMDFFVHKVVEKDREPARRSLDLCTVHPRRVKPGETYSSSPVCIRVHEGDWHTVARAHREWLETWVQKPDRPARFAESIGWHFFFMKHQDGLEVWKYADLPDMARAALAAGCPYLLLFGWQVGGHDNNYFYRYFPNEGWGGQEALAAAVEQCRALGGELMPFYNGTLANTELAEHKEFGHRWEARTRTGHPYYAGDWARHNFDALTRNRAMLHTEIAFCEEQRAYFLESVKRIVQEYRFGNLQLDQISEKMLVDYNEDHILTTPDRVYVDGLAALLPEVRRLVREANPEGVMISEVLNDFTGQWCDSSWDWNILIPFPEPILYTMPWLMASHEIDANEYGEVNKAFAYKMHLDMKIDGGDTAIDTYPAFAAHVKSLADLRRRTAPWYVYGDFNDQDGIHVEAPESALVKVYENSTAKKAAIVMAETAGEKTELQLSLALTLQGTTGVLASNQRPDVPLACAGPMHITLEPHEVRVLMVELV